MVEPLAQKYGDRVVFIEYNVDSVLSEERLDRWWAGYPSDSASMPLTMVDSGFRTHAGYIASASYAQHEAMIEDALARRPQAEVSATWERVGDAVRFNVHVVNRSGFTLDGSNGAAVHVIVYEDAQVLYTQRFARAYAAAPMPPLENNAEGNYTVTTEALNGVNWNKLHFIALVDYQTASGAYDMLQAAVATMVLPPMVVTPGSLMFYAPVGGPAPAAQTLTVGGTNGVAWNVTSTAAWLNASPTSGSVPSQTQASINPAGLPLGVYTGKLQFHASVSQDVNVIAAIGNVKWVYLPLVVH